MDIFRAYCKQKLCFTVLWGIYCKTDSMPNNIS